jgi:hypothetical protein
LFQCFETGRFLGFDSIALVLLMGPVRGFRKRKKTEKKHKENASASGSPEEGPLDWWDEFSSRINGILSLRLCLFLCFTVSVLFFCSVIKC